MPFQSQQSGKFNYQGLSYETPTYSLSRLFGHLKDRGDFPATLRAEPQNVWLGGELDFQSREDFAQGRFSLRGQGLEVQFAVPSLFIGEGCMGSEDLRRGDCVRLEILDLQEVVQGFESGVKVTQARGLSLLTPSLGNRSALVSMVPASEVRLQRLNQWNSLLSEVRALFKSRGLVEVSTPSLVSCPGFEPSLEGFSTQFLLEGASQQDVKGLFLPTSPEIHLKKLLCQGWTDIFEIRSCFRNGELTEQHEPEFTMLEWYRAYADLGLIVEDIQALLHRLQSLDLIVEVGPEDPPLKIEQVRVAELFGRYVGIELKPSTPLAEIKQKAMDLGILSRCPGSQQLSWDDIFHLIFLSCIEPELNGSSPILVTDYPPSQAALSRINSAGWAERYELYWRGLEIANGFDELNDPFEQRQRCQNDLEERLRMGRSPISLDEEFLQALEVGMPPTGGIALGLERLFMACQKLTNIGEIKPFSYQRMSWHSG